jgi:tRNA G18 (ribose-2'-O)-methylase SpoU
MRKLENKELDRLTVTDFKEAKKTPIIIILDDIRSLHNIGSVFRTSDAFLVEKIYLCGITAVPPNKEIHKTALGATETVT